MTKTPEHHAMPEAAENADSDSKFAYVLDKVSWKIIPFMLLLYVVAYLDRINVSFAGLQMNRDLGFNEEVFGLGAGAFFIGYFLFGVPSNIMVKKLGAKRWIAIIMVIWGSISASMSMVKDVYWFYAMRFLLGVAEAGFFPGMILYLTFWFPKREHAKAVARFMTAIPLAGVLGGLVSSRVLLMHGVMGLPGWKWLFIITGTPAIFLGLILYFVLLDGPHECKWLRDDEKKWLLDKIEEQRNPIWQHKEQSPDANQSTSSDEQTLRTADASEANQNNPPPNVLAQELNEASNASAYKPKDASNAPAQQQENSSNASAHELNNTATTSEHTNKQNVFTSGRVWHLAILYFLLALGMYGFQLWLPQIIKNFEEQSAIATAATQTVVAHTESSEDSTAALLSAIPAVFQGLGMVFVAMHSDKKQERRMHVFFSAILAAVGLIACGFFKSPVLALACLSLTAFGIWGTVGPFWAMPTSYLNAEAAAAGIGLINSVGNLGGFVGPSVVGLIKKFNPDFKFSLAALAASLALAGFLALAVNPNSTEKKKSS